MSEGSADDIYLWYKDNEDVFGWNGTEKAKIIFIWKP